MGRFGRVACAVLVGLALCYLYTFPSRGWARVEAPRTTAPDLVRLSFATRHYEPSELLCSDAEGPFQVHTDAVTLDEADALIFYGDEMNSWKFRLKARMGIGRWWYPDQVKPGQLALLYTEESQAVNQFRVEMPEVMNLFNGHVSFDPAADDGGSGPLRVPTNFGVELFFKNFQPELPGIGEKGSVGGLVVWAASNCHPTSNRLQYLKELSRHVVVHSWGKCWPHHDGAKKPLPFSGLGGASASEEFLWMGVNYKFWWAAENQICNSYVSEKMFYPLAYGAVPIIYGSERHHEYQPANRSYIDVRDFSSVKALGDYLAYLDRNDTAYMEYHQWRLRPVHAWNPGFISLAERAGLGVYVGGTTRGGPWCVVGRKILRERNQGAASFARLKSQHLPAETPCPDPRGLLIPK